MGREGETLGPEGSSLCGKAPVPAGSSRCSRGLPDTRVPERASHCALGPEYRVLAKFSLSGTTAQVAHRRS